MKASVEDCKIKQYVDNNNEMHKLIYNNIEVKFSLISYGFFTLDDFIS